MLLAVVLATLTARLPGLAVGDETEDAGLLRHSGDGLGHDFTRFGVGDGLLLRVRAPDEIGIGNLGVLDEGEVVFRQFIAEEQAHTRLVGTVGTVEGNLNLGVALVDFEVNGLEFATDKLEGLGEVEILALTVFSCKTIFHFNGIYELNFMTWSGVSPLPNHWGWGCGGIPPPCIKTVCFSLSWFILYPTHTNDMILRNAYPPLVYPLHIFHFRITWWV